MALLNDNVTTGLPMFGLKTFWVGIVQQEPIPKGGPVFILSQSKVILTSILANSTFPYIIFANVGILI